MINWVLYKFGGLGWRSLKYLPRGLRWKFRHFLALRRYNPQELRYLHKLGPNRGIALDIGANVGLFTHRLAQLYDRVESFEPNPTLLKELNSCPNSNVTIHECGLSDRSGEATLTIPIVGGVVNAGYGTIESGRFEGVNTQSFRIPLKPLDEFGFTGVTFVKMDVEGHEMSALFGGRETIRSNQPIVLVEIKAENLEAVTNWFAEIGYERTTLMDFERVSGSDEDWIFRPKVEGKG